MIEIFKPVVGYEGLYEVSDLGNVRVLDRICKGTRGSDVLRKGKLMDINALGFGNGYKHIGLTKEGKKKRFFIHSLVIAAFIGSRPEGMDVSHKNGCRDDNRAVNLCYESHIENMARMHVHGTVACGTKRYNAKLTDEIVVQMRNLRDAVSITALAKQFGIAYQTAYAAINGRSWKHVPFNY